MAVTVINLSDPVSTWVTKTNTIATSVGDVSLLTVGGGDVVTASNRLDSNIGDLTSLLTTDKSSLVAAINDINSAIDSDYIKGYFASDSANGIIFDSADGQFRLARNTITHHYFDSATTLLIKNSSGTVVKTIYSPGS
jgi:hypothetical protein